MTFSSSDEQIQKVIVVGRQIQRRPVARQAGNDASMFLGKTRPFESLPKQFPPRDGIDEDTAPLLLRQRSDSGYQNPDRFLDTVVGRGQLETAVERIEMASEFFRERLTGIGHGAHGCFAAALSGTGVQVAPASVDR